MSASGHFNKDAELTGFGMLGSVGGSMKGGDIWGDIGSAALHIAPFLLGLGKEHPRNLGKLFAEKMEGSGISGGNWWNDFMSGVDDVTKVILPFAPIIAKAFTGAGGEPAEISSVEGKGGKKDKRGRGRPRKGCGVTGGAILGNPDPYPVQGDSKRIAGKGKSGGAKISPNGDLLAMPSPELSNGVPPKAQLRGAYGGSSDEKVIKAVEKKLGGKKLSADIRMPDMEGGGRSKRNEIVKKIMKEKGMKMIEASKYVKEHGLYKK